MPVACLQEILHHAHRHVRMVIVPDAVIGTILRTAVLKEEKHRTRKPVTGLPASAPGDSSFPENELNVFEYIMVLMTLVLGLGITENLKSITNLNLESHLPFWAILSPSLSCSWTIGTRYGSYQTELRGFWWIY